MRERNKKYQIKGKNLQKPKLLEEKKQRDTQSRELQRK